MRRKAAEKDDGPQKKTFYAIELDSAKLDRVREICDRRMWETYDVAFAQFAFKGPKVNIVGYESGKLVIQGKETEDFILNTLEPEVTGEAVFGYDEVLHPDWFEEHAGLDESGKGDFFGPVDLGLHLSVKHNSLNIGTGIFAGSIFPGSNRLIFTGFSPCWSGFYISSMGGAGLVFDDLGINLLSILNCAHTPSILYLNRTHGEEIEVKLAPININRV